MPTATWQMPDQEWSQVRSTQRRLARRDDLTSGAPAIPDEACGLFAFNLGQSAYNARVEVSPL
jgi:hypothetical protein